MGNSRLSVLANFKNTENKTLCSGVYLEYELIGIIAQSTCQVSLIIMFMWRIRQCLGLISFFFPCILLWPQQPLLYLHISVILNQNLMTASTESLAKVDFTGEEEALSFSSNWQSQNFKDELQCKLESFNQSSQHINRPFGTPRR